MKTQKASLLTKLVVLALLIGVATLFQFWGQKKWVNYEV